MSNAIRLAIPAALLALLSTPPAAADPFFFSTGNPDGKMATASRPDSGFGAEIETGDDFALPGPTDITSATFTGIITGIAPVASIGEVVVEIYRVFPADSNAMRTPVVPTRANSPSDVEFADRNTTPGGGLTFSTTDLGTFSVLNSVRPGGIHPAPFQTTGGNGGLTGTEVEFSVDFTTPFDLPPDHYFFVPQVEVTNGGAFYWLSAPRPIVPPGTPFPPGFTDLQSWTRDGTIDPDWLRVGTDIVGGNPAPTFNAAFSLTGTAVPEASTWAMMLLGLAGLAYTSLRRGRQPRTL